MCEAVGRNAPLSRSNPSYSARLNDEEAKLRWLMSRQPGSLELAYYLIFLLAANARYDKALEECRRVLKSRPDDMIARVWSELLQLGRPGQFCRPTVQRSRASRRLRHYGSRESG